MTQKIIVGNLPADVSVDELTKILTEAGVEQVAITLNNEGDSQRVAAVLSFDGIDRPTADRIADRLNGTRDRDRTLRAYVSLFG